MCAMTLDKLQPAFCLSQRDECNIVAIPRASGIGFEYKLHVLVFVIIENIIAQFYIQVFVVRARSFGVQESKKII